MPPVTSTTPKIIINAAYGTSLENVPGAIASETGELLPLIYRGMSAIYAVAARVDPTYFGDVETIGYDGSVGWPYPFRAESVFRMEKASDNSEVIEVPFDDPQADSGLTGVRFFAGVYRMCGNAKDLATTDSIIFYFSKRPQQPDTLDTLLDPSWRDSDNDLLINVVGLYLAEKDGREKEIPLYLRKIGTASTRFIAHLEHRSTTMRRRTGHIRRFNTQTSVPIMSILTGRAGEGPNPLAQAVAG